MKRSENNRTFIIDLLETIESSPEITNPAGLAKSIDYEVAKVLDFTPAKKEYCSAMIKAINQYYGNSSGITKKKTLEILKEYILGKYFYMMVQENKYLLIQDLTDLDIIDKKSLLAELEIISASEDAAISYLDSLPEGKHRNFINGIISLLY